jgi:hypothetical protein
MCRCRASGCARDRNAAAPPIPSVCPEPPEDLRGYALAQWHKLAPDLFAMSY